VSKSTVEKKAFEGVKNDHCKMDPQYLRASGFALDTWESIRILPHRAARFNEKGAFAGVGWKCSSSLALPFYLHLLHLLAHSVL